LSKSVVYLESDEGSCTGAVVNQAEKFILSAAHCDGPGLLADDEPVKIVAKNRKHDWMIFTIEHLDRPQVLLATKDPVMGEEVGSLGYGLGLERPMFRVGHISDTEMRIPDLTGVFIAIDAPFVGGQSGGPVINIAGELVILVQRANPQMGIGMGAEQLRKRIGKYLPK
jgi:S1-C subfamily serine protease